MVHLYEIVPGHEPDDAGEIWLDEIPAVGTHLIHVWDGEVCWRVVDVSLMPAERGSMDWASRERGEAVQSVGVTLFIRPAEGLHVVAPTDAFAREAGSNA